MKQNDAQSVCYDDYQEKKKSIFLQLVDYLSIQAIELYLTKYDVDILNYALHHVDWTDYREEDYMGADTKSSCSQLEKIELQINDQFDNEEYECLITEDICGEGTTNDYLYFVKVPQYSEVIDGINYNTSTAKQLLFVIYEDKPKQFVMLFRTKEGDYFLYKVFFEKNAQDELYPVTEKTIYPMTYEDAKKFVEINGSVEEYEEIFGI